jgi:hypothetical protein
MEKRGVELVRLVKIMDVGSIVDYNFLKEELGKDEVKEYPFELENQDVRLCSSASLDGGVILVSGPVRIFGREIYVCNDGGKEYHAAIRLTRENHLKFLRLRQKNGASPRYVCLRTLDHPVSEKNIISGIDSLGETQVELKKYLRCLSDIREKLASNFS